MISQRLVVVLNFIDLFPQLIILKGVEGRIFQLTQNSALFSQRSFLLDLRIAFFPRVNAVKKKFKWLSQKKITKLLFFYITTLLPSSTKGKKMFIPPLFGKSSFFPNENPQKKYLPSENGTNKSRTSISSCTTHKIPKRKYRHVVGIRE